MQPQYKKRTWYLHEVLEIKDDPDEMLLKKCLKMIYQCHHRYTN